MATRNEIVFFLNGQRQEVRGGDCFLSLSDFLRTRLGLVGTKIVCSEGDCGSCTVLVGHPQRGEENAELRYLPIDSCIRLMFQLDGCHVVTIEGLGGSGSQHDAETLTAVQKAMVECHGSQCGFCTPGFVMAMTAVQNECNGHAPTEDDWRRSLTGNLCRCTGYTPIIKAGMQATADESPRAMKLEQRFSSGPILEVLKPLGGDTLELHSEFHGRKQKALCPTTVEEAIAYRRQYPQAKIVAGATDVGVQLNKRMIQLDVFLDLNRVAELEGAVVEVKGEGRDIVAGARASWTQLLELCREESPQFAGILEVFGSPQIRHVGTIGGNIVNASPIADSLPFLFIAEAELELASAAGRRWVNINSFYTGYKQFDLRPDELLTRVRIPLSGDDELLRLFKVSRRRDLDISTFTGAIRVKLDGETISHAAVAFGAVGPVVLRLRRTEEYLRGQAFTEETMQSAGDLAVEEITPISDVRGSQDYRLQLARNVFLKFYLEQQAVSCS